MGREDLEAALALMRAARAEKLTLPDEAERDAILAEVADAIWFFGGPPTVTVDGLALAVEPAQALEGVVQYLFIRRHGSVWDVAARAAWHREQAAAAKKAGS
jgi:hypothetical protein